MGAYSLDVGDYPSTAEGLAALFKAPAGREAQWHGPYLDTPNNQPPLDPWKQPYLYRYPGTHNKDSYDIWSKGSDMISGTADDIGNWHP